MPSENRFFDDWARVASGAMSALTGAREEIEAHLKEQFQQILDRMNLVRREEFDAIQAMASKTRLEQERLADRIATLEARLGAIHPGASLAPHPEEPIAPG